MGLGSRVYRVKALQLRFCSGLGFLVVLMVSAVNAPGLLYIRGPKST